MQRMHVHPDNPQPRAIKRAVESLRNDGVVVFLTGTGYSLACKIGNAAGVQRIRRIRDLDDQHLFTVLCRDLSEMASFAKVSNAHFRLIKACLPGAYTFVLPATKQVPKKCRHPQRKTIGLRMITHAVARSVLSAMEEPVLSVSLFPSNTFEQCELDWQDEDPLDRCDPQIDLLLDSGFADAAPSTVVDLTDEQAVILRYGSGDATPFE